MLAEASATREAAVADADAIIEEAQQVSDQLLQESRTEAERVTSEARVRAEGLVSRARTEAEDIARQARAAADAVRARAEAQVEEYRRRVRAELMEQVTREITEQSRRELARVHERQMSMIGDLEASVRILGVSMESAVGNISEMLGALDSLRVHAAESLGDAGVPMNTPPRHAEPLDHLIRSTTDARIDGGPGEPEAEATAEEDAEVEDPAEPEADSSVPESEAVHEPAEEVPGRASDDGSGEPSDVAAVADAQEPPDEGPPLTATEAFLRSAHLDHGDPPLPPMDDADVGARYARDAMRATARARTRRDQETLEVVPERTTPEPGHNGTDPRDERQEAGGEAETSGKPLGWLFRSSS
jgi:hypothetical protein